MANEDIQIFAKAQKLMHPCLAVFPIQGTEKPFLVGCDEHLAGRRGDTLKLEY